MDVARTDDASPPGQAEQPDPGARSHWTRRPLAIAWRVAAGILLLLFLVWLILFITKGRFLKPYFERYASSSAYRSVRVGGDFQLYFAPIDIKFVAERLTISNPAWASRPNLFEARRIETRIATFPLIFGTRRARWLELVDARGDFEWDRTGRLNTWTLGDPAKPGAPFELPTIERARLTGTEIRYRSPPMQLTADLRFDTVEARDTRFADALRFRGDGSMRDRPFRLAGTIFSPNETAGGGRNRLELRALGGGNRLSIEGTLPGAFELEGARLRMAASGQNLRTLVDYLGIVIPETRRYRVRSALTRDGDSWRFTGLTGRFGASDLAGAMTITVPASGRPRIDADLRSRLLDILDAGPWVGYDPRRLEAQGADGAITRAGGRPRLLPDAPLDVSGIARFDARVAYRADRVRMDNAPISNLSLGVVLDRSLLKLTPLAFDVAGGHLTADIAIDARRRPVRTSYDVRLSPTPMGRLLARFGAEQSGTTGTIKARVRMTGTGDSVASSLASSNGRIAIIMPAGSFWTRNVQLSELDLGTFAQKMFEKRLKEPVRINCGLIAFTVRDGIAAADPILIDTSKNVIGGRGGFSFKSEAIDVAIEADSKRFSLFSGQSPIRVDGYFAAPGVDPISGELVGRAGVGLGLAAVASPIAGILAFVDPGDAEATNCGPVLAGARTSGQREADGGRVEEIGAGRTKAPAEKRERKKFLGIF